MGLFIPSASSNTIINTTITGGVDLIVGSTPPLPLIQGTSTVLIMFLVSFPNNAVQPIVPRIRRGITLASTIINVSLGTVNNVAAVITTSGVYADIGNSNISGQQYSVSIFNNGGASITVNDVSITAMVL